MMHPYYNECKNLRKVTLCTRIQEFCWRIPPQESLPFAFCQDTSLHGLKYVGQPKRHLIERLFWLSMFITGAAIAFVLISGVWEKYNNSPVIVSFQEKETKVEQIPFPAITICNVNNVLKSKAHQFISIAETEEAASDASEAALKNVYYLNHICSSLALSFSQIFGYSANGSVVPQELLEKAEALELRQLDSKAKNQNQQTVKEFLQKNAQTCEDMIHLCLWQDEILNCTDIFQAIETDFGKCCTFNMVPQSLLYKYTNDTRDTSDLVEEWAKSDLNVESLLFKSPGKSDIKYPRRTKKAGSTYGLSFMLNPALEEYFCATADGSGFRLSTHLPTQVPSVVDYGIAVEFNREVYITVLPEITTAEKLVEEISLKKRRCYFPGEFTLKYFAFYTEFNCIEECVANLTFQACQCVRYYMPTDSERSLCPPSSLQCINGVQKNLSQDGLSGDCKNCLPSCTEINYVTTTSTSPIRNDVEIWIEKDGRVPEWAANNISIVHVYFGKGSVYSKIRRELYGITDLIANTGGLLGLCLGFSALSALEVIYFLTLRAWFVFRSTMQKGQNLESQEQLSEPVKILANGFQVHPSSLVPVGSDSNPSPYSQFILSELYNYYYNKTKKQSRH